MRRSQPDLTLLCLLLARRSSKSGLILVWDVALPPALLLLDAVTLASLPVPIPFLEVENDELMAAYFCL